MNTMNTMKSGIDVALIEKEGSYGLTKNEVCDLYDMLMINEAYPIEIENPDGESSAMGFITADAAETIDYDYDELSEFVGDILADMNLESEDCIYRFKNLTIWLSR